MVFGECDIRMLLKIKMVKEPKIRTVLSFEPVILPVFTGPIPCPVRYSTIWISPIFKTMDRRLLFNISESSNSV